MKRLKAVVVDDYKVVAGFVKDIKTDKVLIQDGETGAVLYGEESRFEKLKAGDLVVAAVDAEWRVVELEQSNRTFLIDLGGKKGQIACRVGRVGPVDKGTKGQTIISFPESVGAATRWKKVSYWNGREGTLADDSYDAFQKVGGSSPTMLVVGKKAGDKYVNGVAFLKIRRPS